MARHSNQELTAERKEIAALLADVEGESLVDKVRTALAGKPAVPTDPGEPGQASYAQLVRENMALTSQLKHAHASIHAHDVPGYAPAEEPPTDPAMGDLTPIWARWFIARNPREAAMERYMERLHFLPDDVQKSLSA